MKDTKFAIIIPCFNEEEALPTTINKLKELMHNLIQKKVVAPESFLVFVDDGSTDKTWEILENASKNSFCSLKALKFSRNYGNQSAIIAGLDMARKLEADAVLTIDADLQQDISKIEEFISAYDEGYDIVAGIRNNYKTSLWKKMFSAIFYKTINLLGVNLNPNHSEFRLINKKTLDIINNFKERNIFLRGLFSDLGLKIKYVNYDVNKRALGESKFSFVSLFKLAMTGIVSYSTYPLRFVFLTGFIISLSCFIVAFLILLEQILKVDLIFEIEFYKVWTTFISGIQILCIGIIGEYIGQILQEVKGRPRYIVVEEL